MSRAVSLARRAKGRTWCLVGAFALVAVARSVAVGVPLRDPAGEWLLGKVAWTLGLLVLLVPAEGAVRARSARPGPVVAAIRERWVASRVALAASALAAYHLTYACYHNLKSLNAFRTVHDDWLAAADRWLFLGHSPGELLHDWLGTGASAWALIGVYEFFPTVVTLTVALAVVLPRDIVTGARVLAALTVVWMLGTLTYYAIPSLGPFHQAPADFAPLPRSIVTATQDRYLAERAHLLAHPLAAGAHAQVAAFASLHVGVSATIWLSVRRHVRRWVDLAAAAFVLLTVVATVYVGWHFVVDDLAGLLIAWLAVAVAPVLVSPDRERQAEPRASQV